MDHTEISLYDAVFIAWSKGYIDYESHLQGWISNPYEEYWANFWKAILGEEEST